MAKYEGGWFVQRYWMRSKWGASRKRGRSETMRFSSGRALDGNTFLDGYVVMWFPRRLYPTKTHLPSKREEIRIWP